MTREGKVRRIVVALDPFADEAAYMIDWIIDNFLQPGRDDVRLVSALSLQSNLDSFELGMNVHYAAQYVADWENEMERKVRDFMKEHIEKLQKANINASIEILKSPTDSRNVIVDYTEKTKGDILVMGSRDLSTWKRLFLGSFADFCHHNARCPILIVKQPRKDKH